MIFTYLSMLIISPQLWLFPVPSVPVDYIVYPIWLGVLLATGRAKDLLRTGWQDAFFLLFVIWLSLSAIANAQSGISTHHISYYAKWFVLYKMVAASLPSMNRVRRVGVTIVLLSSVLVVESIDHMHDPDQMGWAGQSLGWISQSAMESGVIGRTQWTNIFDGPGVFCVVFTLALPFLLRFLDGNFSVFTRATAVMLLGPLMLAIYYTGSRGGFLATLAILGMHFCVRTRISMTKLVAVAVLLAMLFVAAPAYMTSIYDENRSAQHRVDVWMQGLWMLKDNPVFGVGRGHYARHTGRLIAHNSAIEIAAETGLPGFFFWAALIYMGFKQLWLYQRQKPKPTNRSYVMALGICLAGYLVSAMFVTLEYETLYFLLGVTAATGMQLETPARFGRRDGVLIVGLVGAFLFGLKVVTALYY